ncbi:MAG: hypothetical protein MHPDNHAH_03176 [Anaerolineales bacterium]|nr:hypothetical protein [Anaerolineales bacterium]
MMRRSTIFLFIGLCLFSTSCASALTPATPTSTVASQSVSATIPTATREIQSNNLLFIDFFSVG